MTYKNKSKKLSIQHTLFPMQKIFNLKSNLLEMIMYEHYFENN
jgi:hypothetical protein